MDYLVIYFHLSIIIFESYGGRNLQKVAISFFWLYLTKNDLLRENFQNPFRSDSSRHRSTCRTQISWNLADGKSAKSCLTKKTKFCSALQVMLLLWSSRKSARADPGNSLRVLQISPKSVHFRRSYRPIRTREHRQSALECARHIGLKPNFEPNN